VAVGVENELFAEIKSGLKGDEQVILGPFDSLHENAPVQPSVEPQNSGI
jgi:HlyD family secretion protein